MAVMVKMPYIFMPSSVSSWFDSVLVILVPIGIIVLSVVFEICSFRFSMVKRDCTFSVLSFLKSHSCDIVQDGYN